MRVAALILVAQLCVNTLAFAAPDESLEPPLPHFLQIGEERYEFKLGEKLPVKGSFVDPVITVHAGDYRVFDYGGVRFEYPAKFGWEAEQDGDTRTWTLSGNDFKILYFRMKVGFSAERYAEKIRERMPKSSPVVPIERDFGGKRIVGAQVVAHFSEYAVRHEAFEIPVKDGAAMLVFQDADNGGKGSTEAAQTLPRMLSSFRIK